MEDLLPWVTAFGAVAGPVILYVTRKRSINDDINRELQDDFDKVYKRINEVGRDRSQWYDRPHASRR